MGAFSVVSAFISTAVGAITGKDEGGGVKSLDVNVRSGTITATVDETTLAKESKQDTGNASLSSIDGKTPALVSGRQPVDGSGVTQPVSAVSLPLPSGASTSANQTTGNTSLASILAELDVALSTRASQVTIAAILSQFDVALSTRASEATLALIKAKTDNLDVLLSTRASQTTLVSVLAQLDVALSTRASQATVALILAQLDVALSTRLADATFTARVNTLGQKTSANSTPVVVASDQSAIPVSQSGTWTVGLTTEAIEIGTVDQGTPAVVANSWPIKITDGTNTASVKAASTAAIATDKAVVAALSPNTPLPAGANVLGHIIVDSSALPTGAATESTLATRLADATFTGRINTQGQKAMAASTPVVIASDQTAVPASQSGTWNINNVSGTVSLPTGAATSALQTTGNTSLASIDTKTPALVGGRVPVDGSGVTQPVSAVSLPLPSGAATEATLATRLSESDFDTKTGALTETAPATDTASSGLNGRLQRIAQRLTSLIALLPSALVGGRLDINIGSRTAMTGSAPATFAVTAASQTAVAANASRKGLVLTNASLTQVISLGLEGATAVASRGITLFPNGGVWVMDPQTYTLGAITAIADVTGATLSIQEFS